MGADQCPSVVCVCVDMCVLVSGSGAVLGDGFGLEQGHCQPGTAENW